MNATLPLARHRSLAATGGLLAFGALLAENLLLVALLFNPDAPALRAVGEALFKVVVVVMMHNWPALLAAVVGVVALTWLGLNALESAHPLPEDG